MRYLESQHAETEGRMGVRTLGREEQRLILVGTNFQLQEQVLWIDGGSCVNNVHDGTELHWNQPTRYIF